MKWRSRFEIWGGVRSRFGMGGGKRDRKIIGWIWDDAFVTG
ncbi:hypothetical protein [Argonema galeatum]|nr:hypothetical protein [Argonema galeatum]